MIKKLFLLCLFINGSLIIKAQANLNPAKGRTCATPIPSIEWDNWFNAEVEKTKTAVASGKTSAATYVIPVVVHIIHNGQAVGVADNITQAQVIDQIAILNADFAGTGLNNGNAPAVFAPAKADCQISFCLAVKDPTGGILPEPGIDRIDRNSKGWTTGPYATAYINSTIKPNTIWDPVRYCNMWIMDLGGGLLGYATFPAGTTLPGITGVGTATSDGVVMLNTSFGSIGTATAPPYHKGRTTTHEVGHWLGLRHIWGDGTCLTDFCNDTPPAQNSNFGCPAFPFNNGVCAGNTTGEMTMNFMDYTDDLCMYMFTLDQKTRAQTAMTQGTYRSLLGTHGLCSTAPPPPPSPPVAAFNVSGQPCVGQSFVPTNNTSGGPPPTYVWSASPSASFSPNNNVPTPSVSFPTPGNYVLYVTATNSAGTSSYSMAFADVKVCPKPAICVDTLVMIKNTDTLTTYKAPNNQTIIGCQTGYAGFATGTNCFKDKEYAQFFSSSTYSDTPFPQVNSVIVLFNKAGTKSTSSNGPVLNCRIYGGSTSGPSSQIGGNSPALLGAIASSSTATTQVSYIGNPAYVFPSATIIPYKFDFTNPVAIGASGFFASIETPYTSPNDSMQIFSNTKPSSINDSSSWVLQYNNNWKTLRYNRSAKVQLAILPIITCRPVVGLAEYNAFAGNISIMPNPNNGVFNIAFTFVKAQQVTVTIYNAVGRLISKNQFNEVSSHVFNADLSAECDGVYIMEISDGTQKINKKIIIAH